MKSYRKKLLPLCSAMRCISNIKYLSCAIKALRYIGISSTCISAVVFLAITFLYLEYRYRLYQNATRPNIAVATISENISMYDFLPKDNLFPSEYDEYDALDIFNTAMAIANDKKVKQVFLSNHHMRNMPFATALDAVNILQKKGKKVSFILDKSCSFRTAYSNGCMVLISKVDEVIATPHYDVDLVLDSLHEIEYASVLFYGAKDFIKNIGSIASVPATYGKRYQGFFNNKTFNDIYFRNLILLLKNNFKYLIESMPETERAKKIMEARNVAKILNAQEAHKAGIVDKVISDLDKFVSDNKIGIGYTSKADPIKFQNFKAHVKKNQDTVKNSVHVIPFVSPFSRNSVIDFAKSIMFAIENKAKGIVLLLNSPGGNSEDGGIYLDAVIDYAKSKKVPLVAFADGLCASACLEFASYVDTIYAGKGTLYGNLGVAEGSGTLTEHKNGFLINKKYHPLHFNLNKTSQPLLDSNDISNQFSSNKNFAVQYHDILKVMYKSFQKRVFSTRNITNKQDRARISSAELFTSKESKKLNLIDGESTLLRIIKSLNGDSKEANVFTYNISEETLTPMLWSLS